MILVTGGTGFIGRALVRRLAESGHSVRMLLRPNPRTPRLPTGVPVEVAVTGLGDVRGLRAALHGVDVIYHLAGGEHAGGRAKLQEVDIDGTRDLVEAAADARVERIFYLSHLGANRAAAFPLLKTKGIAEEYIRRSGVPYTIMRSAVVFGVEDHFTTSLALMIAALPFVMFLPGRGEALIQPLWVEDLATCLAWALDEISTANQTYEIGGIEHFSFRRVIETIMGVIRKRRLMLPLSMPSLRALTVILEATFPRFPTSGFWLDYLAVNRTCALDSVPRTFGLLPARFTSRLDHLRGVRWGREALQMLFIGR